MTKTAAKKCFEATGLKPVDVDVIELHDCFSANELITYEALGLCSEGEALPVLASCRHFVTSSFSSPLFFLVAVIFEFLKSKL